MPLRFVDDGGNEGWIDDDLSVEYVGGIDVEAAIDEIVDEGMSTDEAFNELIVRLPQDRPISSIERDELRGPRGGRASGGTSTAEGSMDQGSTDQGSTVEGTSTQADSDVN